MTAVAASGSRAGLAGFEEEDGWWWCIIFYIKEVIGCGDARHTGANYDDVCL